jgi:predicted PurR-regulated permease PerM
MKDHYLDKIAKLIPGVIILLFFFTFFRQMVLCFETILTPTILTAITLIILIPFKKEHKVINTLIAIILFLYGIWLLTLIKTIVIPFVIAIVIAYISDPVVMYLEKKKIARSNAILLLIGLIILAFIILLLFIIPALVNEISGFVSQIPSMKNTFIEWFNNLQKIEFLKKLGEYKIPPYLEEATNKLFADIQNSASEISKKSIEFVTESFSNVMKALIGLLELLIIPIFVFYILEEKNEIKRLFKAFIPQERRENIFSLIDEINNTLSTFLRGQLFNCTVIGTITFISFSLIGIKFPLLIGFFTGIMTFIPYVGNIIGPSPGLLLVLFTADPLFSLLMVIITIVGVHLLDSYYLYPTVHGKTLKLSPLMIMMAVIIGGQLYGAPGMFLAIPSICVLKVLCRGWIKKYEIHEKVIPPAKIDEESKLLKEETPSLPESQVESKISESAGQKISEPLEESKTSN